MRCSTIGLVEFLRKAFFIEAIAFLSCDRPRAALVAPMKENETEHLFDEIGWKILGELQQNARIAFAELGRRVGLSTPAVTERVHKMEEAGIILGYRAQIDPAKAGLPILAFITVKVSGENLIHFMNLAAKSARSIGVPSGHRCGFISAQNSRLRCSSPGTITGCAHAVRSHHDLDGPLDRPGMGKHCQTRQRVSGSRGGSAFVSLES